MNEKQNETLQAICRVYLCRLRHLANKHGLKSYLNDLIKRNKEGKCKATEYECEMLARMVNDERIQRNEIPKLIGKSYRQCNDDGTFERIKKLPRVGIYSKVNAIIFNHKNKTRK